METIPSCDTVNSGDPRGVLGAHISKLESQLHEIEIQKEAEIAAALETGRKEGYILGCQERLEAARQVVDIAGSTSRQLSFTGGADTKSTAIASAICTPRDITALHSDSRNPWGSLSRRHCRSHPRKPSTCIRHHPFYTTDNRKHIPRVRLSSTEMVMSPLDVVGPATSGGSVPQVVVSKSGTVFPDEKR